MDDLLYESCLKYFTALSHFGYRNEYDVKKLLFYVYIQELVNNTSIAIPEEDYKSIERSLYTIYGTTCLIPYPNYCERNMFNPLGDIVELSARVDKIEELDNVQNDRLTTIEDTKVAKDEQDDIEDITDINV